MADIPQFANPMRLANPNATTSPVIYGDDTSLYAEFYDEEIYNTFRSDAEGRAIFDRVVYCKIIFPADRLKTFIEKVKMNDDNFGPSHPRRFPRQWAAYQAQHEQVPDGMPLEQWPPMTKQRVRELKSMHIHTVEAVAALTDQNGPNIGMDWRKLRDMAKATLKPNEAAKEISALTQKIEELTAKVEANAMAQLTAPARTSQRKDKKAVVDPFEDETGDTNAP